MQNPILQMLNGKQNSQNNVLSRINSIKMLLSGKNPRDVYQNLMQSNPEFKKFVMDNENKTIEEIAMEYDIDLSLLKNIF